MNYSTFEICALWHWIERLFVYQAEGGEVSFECRYSEWYRYEEQCSSSSSLPFISCSRAIRAQL